MIKYKTLEEIEIMAEGGKRLRRVVKKLIKILAPGTRTKEIDRKAEELIKREGGKPSFKTVANYHWATCISVNEQIVHTPPSERILQDGDIVTLDIGMFYKGFHTDFATTVGLGKGIKPEIRNFLSAGKETLKKAIKRIKPGVKLGEVSGLIEKEISKRGFYIIKELTGHGIGRRLHEEPNVFNFLDRPLGKTLTIKPGLVVAVEVIYSLGTEKLTLEEGSDWSLVTSDKSLSASFEHTVAVLPDKTIILT